MKVAYNACYGGFGLSPKATILYAERKGIKLYPYSCSRGITHFREDDIGSITGFVDFLTEDLGEEGTASGIYRPVNDYSLNTECLFKFSGGTFSTELNPTLLFGGYRNTSWRVEGYSNADRCQVGKHMHIWLQRQVYNGRGYSL